MFQNTVLSDPVHDHESRGNRFARGFETGELASVNAAKDTPDSNQIAFGNHLLGNKFVGREGSFDLLNMFHEVGVGNKARQKVRRLWLAGEGIEIVDNQLPSGFRVTLPPCPFESAGPIRPGR